MTELADLTLPAGFHTGEVLVRAAAIEDVDADNRLVDVRLMSYEQEAQIDDELFEVFTRGAFKAATSNVSRVKVTNQGHDRATIIGQAVDLRDEDAALFGTLKIADTVAGRDVLTLLREKVLEELSVEFRPMPRYFKVDRLPRGLLVRHHKATLLAVSPVAAGAYGDGSRVLATREAASERARERVLAELASLDSGSNTLAGLR